MISSHAALQIILNNTEKFGIEEIPFLKASGRILKEEIKADRDFPPYDNVRMDGIAISFNAFAEGKRTFNIENVQAAGSKQLILQNKYNCIEVMTGAVLPENTDTVIRYEDLSILNGAATINIETINKDQNVHPKGKDRRVSDILIHNNRVISSAEIGILATVGKSMVTVAKQPKVMIVSTGDELVDVSEQPLTHQIRRSNVYSLASLLERLNINTKIAHIADDKIILKKKIEQFLIDYDVLLFSGAVSKGKFDFLPEVLNELGVEKLFHKVKQRPGKPLFFGTTNTKKKHQKTTVFGFPGNPVSTFSSCIKYFYPWYKKSMSIIFENQEKAILSENFTFKPALTYFLQVQLETKKGQVIATPITGNGSGDLANLANADGFLELPDNQTNFKKGEVFPLIKYR